MELKEYSTRLLQAAKALPDEFAKFDEISTFKDVEVKKIMEQYIYGFLPLSRVIIFFRQSKYIPSIYDSIIAVQSQDGIHQTYRASEIYHILRKICKESAEYVLNALAGNSSAALELLNESLFSGEEDKFVEVIKKYNCDSKRLTNLLVYLNGEDLEETIKKIIEGADKFLNFSSESLEEICDAGLFYIIGNIRSNDTRDDIRTIIDSTIGSTESEVIPSFFNLMKERDLYPFYVYLMYERIQYDKYLLNIDIDVIEQIVSRPEVSDVFEEFNQRIIKAGAGELADGNCSLMPPIPGFNRKEQLDSLREAISQYCSEEQNFDYYFHCGEFDGPKSECLVWNATAQELAYFLRLLYSGTAIQDEDKNTYKISINQDVPAGMWEAASKIFIIKRTGRHPQKMETISLDKHLKKPYHKIWNEIMRPLLIENGRTDILGNR